MKSLQMRLAAAAVSLMIVAASAFATTPEGVVITNLATFMWSDSNGNAYAPASASVSTTVGFVAGATVSSAATVSVTSPSVGNALAFDISNSGNGMDEYSVSTVINAPITVTGYRIGSTTYASLAELNAALAATTVASGQQVSVTVMYTVAPGQGGQTLPASLTATSIRDPQVSGSSTTLVEVVASAGANVTPDGAVVNRLPGNGGAVVETAIFLLSNTGNASDTYTLAATSSNEAVVVVSGLSGSGVSGSQVTLPPGQSVNLTVSYVVADAAAAGSTSTITLTATSGIDASVNDTGTLTVTVVRPALAAAKLALRADQTTPISSGDRVLPGERIHYRISVTNTGTAAASNVAVSDVLPDGVDYVSATPATGTWSFAYDAGTRTLTATLTGTLGVSQTHSFLIEVDVK